MRTHVPLSPAHGNSQVHAAATPVLEAGDVQIPDAYWPGSLAEWMSHRFKDRLCLKQQGREQKMVMVDVDL